MKTFVVATRLVYKHISVAVSLIIYAQIYSDLVRPTCSVVFQNAEHVFWICVHFFLMLFALFLRHAHYQTGNTPLALVWKDEKCSQYVIDTDNKGQVPDQQQVNLGSPFRSCKIFFFFSKLFCAFHFCM